MKKIIKNNYKIMIAFVLGIIVSGTTVYAVDAYIESNKVSYDNHNEKITKKNNVQESIDELYERSGIHKEKWVDPILNGADPVLKEPLIPVEIKPNGEVYYANLNSEWYNYSEKRWANAVILIDNPSNTNYGVGDHILEKDIESYFVWIPRYKYKVWDLGNYTKQILLAEIQDATNLDDETAFWKVVMGKAKIIDVVFGNSEYVKIADDTKQGSGISGGDSGVAVGNYLIHPAFKLGDKNLNGFWIGKFETGYKGATNKSEAEVNNEEKDSIIIKPDVYSWCGISIKNMFNTSYNYERNLDSHMIKNTEWGAVAYLSHSQYGIGTEVNINNNSDYRTGYSSTANANQNIYPGEGATSEETDKTQPWNTSVGYLASTTGNISGIYDMSGGTEEYTAAYRKNTPSSSEFTQEEINAQVLAGYIDEYSADSKRASYNNRILGDATGELGPFYQYYAPTSFVSFHNNWYGEYAGFIDAVNSWFARGGGLVFGINGGYFMFTYRNGGPNAMNLKGGFRIALAVQ